MSVALSGSPGGQEDGAGAIAVDLGAAEPDHLPEEGREGGAGVAAGRRDLAAWNKKLDQHTANY